MGIKVVSLFDGMSCGRIALDRLGIKVDKYVASEIDKYAIKVAKANYPNIIHMGSVTELSCEDGVVYNWLEEVNMGDIYLFIGGSPCQSFSFAGSRKGMVTKDNVEILTLEHYLQLKEEGFEFQGQSYLFWEYVRLLKEVQKENPDVIFLLENVKMAKKWQDLISGVLGVEPIVINSALLSAQNRVRLYWTNIKGITQPEDRGILLKDIIDYSVPFINTFDPTKTKLKPSETAGVITVNPKKVDGTQTYQHDRIYDISGKFTCLTAEMSGRYNVAKPINLGNVNPSGRGQNGNVYSVEGLSPCLTTNKGEGVKIAAFVGVEQRGRGKNPGGMHENKSPTLTSHSWEHNHKAIFGEIRPATITGRRINEKGVRDDYDKSVPITQCLQVKHDPSKAPCLTTVEKDCLLSLEEPGRYLDAYNRPELLWRKLTPIECERLQTVPDNYTDHVSNSQRYRMLGNGWTVDVIAHILSFIKWQ